MATGGVPNMSSSAIDEVVRLDIRHGALRTVAGVLSAALITFLLY